jgi:hypothetical protein
MKRIFLSLALLGAVAQVKADFDAVDGLANVNIVAHGLTQADVNALNSAFPEGMFGFVRRQAGMLYAAASEVISEKAAIAGEEPVIKTAIETSKAACAKVGQAAASAKEFAPKIPGATLELIKNNPYTLAIGTVIFAGATYGVYKLCTKTAAKETQKN